MYRRPSVFVLALTVGDYLLWNWSLNASHDAIALVAGLTLPPLALVSFWVLALGAMRALAMIVRRPPSAVAQAHMGSAGARRPGEPAAAAASRATASPVGTEAVPAESPRIAA